LPCTDNTIYVFFDPLCPRCAELETCPELVGYRNRGRDLFWVPVHTKSGSMKPAAAFLRDAGLRLGCPPETRGFFGGLGRKAYFRWIEGGGDSGDPGNPFFAPRDGEPEEAPLVLLNTFWHRKLLAREVPQLPYYLWHWEEVLTGKPLDAALPSERGGPPREPAAPGGLPEATCLPPALPDRPSRLGPEAAGPAPQSRPSGRLPGGRPRKGQ
jgi:hypothetical protein